jgi:hypothetical protein
MKPTALFILLTIGFTYISCEKKNVVTDSTFEAEVLGRNSDCGLFAVKFPEKLDQIMALTETSSSDGVYIAENLPEDLKTSGLVIILKIRKPQPTELGFCTDLGISYPWIWVIDARIK